MQTKSGVDGDATRTQQELELSTPGAAMGTLAYMSPEQARAKDLDGRTDIFSFGLVLYEMVTGQQGFSGGSSAEIFDEILNRAPIAPVRLNPAVPAELERIINKALEKNRDLRYQHASEMRTDLQRLKRDTDSGRVSTRARELSRLRTCLRRKWLRSSPRRRDRVRRPPSRRRRRSSPRKLAKLPRRATHDGRFWSPQPRSHWW